LARRFFTTRAAGIHTKLLINNQWVDSRAGETFGTVNPSTLEEICQVQKGGAEDIDLAVQAARHAFEKGPWASYSVAERGELLHRVADNLEKHKAELAALESTDNGKPLKNGEGDVEKGIQIMRHYAGWTDKLHG